MPRIVLAHWHAGRAPGTELDVTDDELRQLLRDGRVAPATDGPVGAEPSPEPEAPAEPEAATAPEPADTPPPKSNRRRQ